MEFGNRPSGRQRRTGSGTGNVGRRGSGFGGNSGGPVGNPGGYSGRSSVPSSRSTSSGSAGGRGSMIGNIFGGGGSSAGGGIKKIVIIAIIIISIILIVKQFLGTSNDPTPANSNGFSGNTSYPDTYIDSGEYPVNLTVSSLARSKHTILLGDGNDKVTVMIYMCGTDLETVNGMATADINEILYADISDKVNIILETGGTGAWQNNVISSNTNQRYRMTENGLELLDGNLGQKSMVLPATLSDFIKFSKLNYPADRYILVMWDHGGGSLSGYGYDEHFKGDSMTLDEIGIALKNGGCNFDLVGFDACLMATLETAIVVEPYADYLVASTEVEPGIGWQYTGWISALSTNTSIPSTDLGKLLIDDYIKDVKARVQDSQATLSLIDLAELKGTVPSSFKTFASSTGNLIDNNEYKKVSDARINSKEFATSAQINQIDLIHFAENLNTKESNDFADVLRGCIKYNRSSNNIINSNGISIFFPYGNLPKLNSMLETYDAIGIEAEYTTCIRSFASITAGGQVVSSGNGNFLEVLLNGLTGNSQTSSGTSSGASALMNLLNEFIAGGDFSSITGLIGDSGWLDTGKMRASVDYYADNRFDSSSLKITNSGGQMVLSLSEDQWTLVQNLEMNVFIDDGEGFIDLGLDNVYDFNAKGDLIMEYDGTWIALNGHIVSYYMISDDRYDDNYIIRGRIPAMLNGQLVDIIVVFDNLNPYGIVSGAQVVYNVQSETETIAKGLLDIAVGDKIDYLCDYYTYEGQYSNSYFLGEQYTATGEWEISNLTIENADYQMTYRITDIYNNQYWTPSVTD